MAADTESMDRAIGQFLDFARPEKTDIAPADVNAIATELVQQFAARGVTVTAELAPLPPVAVWPDALRRAVLNLLENAAAYGGGG